MVAGTIISVYTVEYKLYVNVKRKGYVMISIFLYRKRKFMIITVIYMSEIIKIRTTNERTNNISPPPVKFYVNVYSFYIN